MFWWVSNDKWNHIKLEPMFSRGKMHVESKHGGGITPYYTTIINSTIEICKFLNGTDKNPITKFIIDTVSKTAAKDFFHPCPYFGPVKLINVSFFDNSMSSQFLQRRHKILIRAFDNKDDNIITMKIETEDWSFKSKLLTIFLKLEQNII